MIGICEGEESCIFIFFFLGMHSCLTALDLSTALTGSILNFDVNINFVYVCMESSMKKILFVNDRIGNVKFTPIQYILIIY